MWHDHTMIYASQPIVSWQRLDMDRRPVDIVCDDRSSMVVVSFMIVSFVGLLGFGWDEEAVIVSSLVGGSLFVVSEGEDSTDMDAANFAALAFIRCKAR